MRYFHRIYRIARNADPHLHVSSERTRWPPPNRFDPGALSILSISDRTIGRAFGQAARRGRGKAAGCQLGGYAETAVLARAAAGPAQGEGRYHESRQRRHSSHESEAGTASRESRGNDYGES